jgi:hypothetical protein
MKDDFVSEFKKYFKERANALDKRIKALSCEKKDYLEMAGKKVRGDYYLDDEFYTFHTAAEIAAMGNEYKIDPRKEWAHLIDESVVELVENFRFGHSFMNKLPDLLGVINDNIPAFYPKLQMNQFIGMINDAIKKDDDRLKEERLSAENRGLKGNYSQGTNTIIDIAIVNTLKKR